MTDTIRLIVPIAYDSWVVPRGARKVRPMTFAARIAVEFRTIAASDLSVGVAMRNSLVGSNLDYPACEHGLFETITKGWGMGSPPLEADLALASLSAGDDLHADTHRGNPFLGLSRRLRGGQSPRPIEEAALRSIERDGYADAVAAAHRLAADFLVVDDGRILRRTNGPMWSSAPVHKTISPQWALDGNIGTGLAVEFNALRLEDALDYHRRYVGTWDGGRWGKITVADPNLVPDLDVWRTALGLSSREFFQLSISDVVRNSYLAPMADRVAGGFEMLLGSHRDDIADPAVYWSAPITTVVPDPAQIAGHVEVLREFAEELKAVVDKPLRLDHGLLVRWDEYEHARAVVEAMPDLASLAEPRP